MVKVRAQRRAERERKQRQALEYNAKRLRRRMFWRKVTLHEMRRRSNGRLFARRSRGERAIIGVVAVLILVVIWTALPSVGPVHGPATTIAARDGSSSRRAIRFTSSSLTSSMSRGNCRS